jgi:transposase-like protein
MTGTDSESGRNKYPSRGKRYSPAMKKEILDYASDNDVASAGAKFMVTETTIYDWRRAAKRRKGATSACVSQAAGNPAADRDRRILAMWRQHPGYGPSQIRNMLKRAGFRVSVGTVRNVMEENGYLPPTLKRKEHVGRYGRFPAACSSKNNVVPLSR